jgi:plastocyanin
MKRVIALTGAVALISLGAGPAPVGISTPPKTATVAVHCPVGKTAAFVTPEHLTIAVGDSVEWQAADSLVSDTIDISLKDARRAWPFAGRLARGRRHARAHAARTRGTYAYSVRMQCTLPNGKTRRVVIDPDMIIQ